ncbi:MAG: hypothetical protein P8107_15440, partial [Spirochaetia bacterium]
FYERKHVFQTAVQFLPAFAFAAGRIEQITIEPRGKTLHIQAPPGIYIRIRTNQYELEDADQAKIIYQYKHMPVTIILTTKSVHDIRFK